MVRSALPSFMRRLTALLIVIALPTVAAPQGGVRGAIVGTVVGT